MPRDPYDDEERPEPRKAAAGGLSITQNLGPLPVWGWGAVVIAAVFLWRRIGGTPKGQAAAAVAGATAPAYTPATGGVYLLPGANAGTPNGTGTAPAPAPTYLPAYPNGGQGQAPAGGQCAPGRTLVQGATGYTCATGAEAGQLGAFLASVKK